MRSEYMRQQEKVDDAMGGWIMSEPAPQEEYHNGITSVYSYLEPRTFHLTQCCQHGITVAKAAMLA